MHHLRRSGEGRPAEREKQLRRSCQRRHGHGRNDRRCPGGRLQQPSRYHPFLLPDGRGPAAVTVAQAQACRRTEAIAAGEGAAAAGLSAAARPRPRWQPGPCSRTETMAAARAAAAAGLSEAARPPQRWQPPPCRRTEAMAAAQAAAAAGLSAEARQPRPHRGRGQAAERKRWQQAISLPPSHPKHDIFILHKNALYLRKVEYPT